MLPWSYGIRCAVCSRTMSAAHVTLPPMPLQAAAWCTRKEREGRAQPKAVLKGPTAHLQDGVHKAEVAGVDKAPGHECTRPGCGRFGDDLAAQLPHGFQHRPRQLLLCGCGLGRLWGGGRRCRRRRRLLYRRCTILNASSKRAYACLRCPFSHTFLPAYRHDVPARDLWRSLKCMNRF